MARSGARLARAKLKRGAGRGNSSRAVEVSVNSSGLRDYSNTNYDMMPAACPRLGV